MATYTREELVRSVLFELGAVDANEAPEAEDAELCNKSCQQKLEELYEDGLIPFDLDGEIPARYFTPLVRVIAPLLLLPFGAQARAQVIDANEHKGMQALQKLRQKSDLSEPTQAIYF